MRSGSPSNNSSSDRFDRRKCLKLYDSAIEADSWGQLEEALEAYGKLVASLTQAMRCEDPNDGKRDSGDGNAGRGGDGANTDGSENEGIIVKLVTSLNIRQRELRADANLGVGLSGIRKIREALEDVGSGKKAVPFPFHLNPKLISAAYDELRPEGSAVQGGSLLRPPTLSSDEVGIKVVIEKIGLKDAAEYIDPFITLSVVNENGVLMESPQDTPYSTKLDGKYLHFQCTIYMQTPLNALPRNGAVMLEFKHYKPDKQKTSVRAFSFLDKDELQKAPCSLALELYKKPTDWKRKNLRLFTVKQLYTHVSLKKILA